MNNCLFLKVLGLLTFQREIFISTYIRKDMNSADIKAHLPQLIIQSSPRETEPVLQCNNQGLVGFFVTMPNNQGRVYYAFIVDCVQSQTAFECVI